ncbi:MAG: DnaB-like helicase N-terminal domain-containing protein, partial [Bacteroidales bacterium]
MAKKSANPSGSGIPLELGKLPPQAPELEEAVLGAVMLEKGAISSVAEVLRPDSFYKEQHKVIFEAMLALFARHDPIDMLTVAEELRRKKSLDEVGGAAYIAHLTSRVASAAHADFHSRIIQQKYIQRELIRVSSDMLHSAFDDG